MKLSTKKNIFGWVLILLIGAMSILVDFNRSGWIRILSVITTCLFIAFVLLFEVAIQRKTFATGDVFYFEDSTQFKVAISKLIQEKIDKLIKTDREQRKVLDVSKEDGAYHRFIIEAGEKFVKEMRLVFDLSLRTSNLHLVLLQKEFAQALRDTKSSGSIFFKNLPEESSASFLYMQGLPEVETN